MATSNPQTKETPNHKERSESSPAHSPGHQKLNLKEQFGETTGDKSHHQNASALNHMAGNDVIARNQSPQRRVISGASIEKKGQRNRE